MPSYSFASIAFGPAYDDRQPVVSPGKGYYSVRHVPYSRYDVLDIGGIGPKTYGPIEVKILPANSANWEATYQRTAGLIIADVTYATATLVQMTDKTQTPRLDYYFYTCTWIIS